MSRLSSLCAIVLAATTAAAQAHEAFSEFVWHRVEVARNAEHLDITVRLTFFEEWSERERRQMDADGDGRIGRSEREGYARSVAAFARSQLGLRIGGHAVDLVQLYEAEVDLMGREGVERAHHELTLRFFARPPAGIAPGAGVELADRLWPEAKSHAEMAASANGAVSLHEMKVAERSSGRAGEPIRFLGRWP